jgi:hypothetical protein
MNIEPAAIVKALAKDEKDFRQRRKLDGMIVLA